MGKWEMVTFTLNGCEHCEHLERGLKSLNIPYTDIDVSNNPFLGDKIEHLYKCKSYPMIVLKEPQNIVWLPESSLLPSPSIRIYGTINELLENILQTFKN
jgi:glutaredoxin